MMSGYSILFSVSIVTVSISALEFEFFEANACAISETDLIKAYTSYHECLNHCKTRMDCAAVSYLQKATLCRLSVGLSIPGTCQGYVYSNKDNWEKDDLVECRCNNGQQCKQNGNCVTSECSKLGDPVHGKLLGTQFSIGDKITFMCYPGYVPQTSGKRVCTSNGTWSGQDAICVEDENCAGYLVSGPGGVKDRQLSESSYWCQNEFIHYLCKLHHGLDGMSARFARLHSLGYITGSWSAMTNNPNEYIQVNFLALRVISGIVLRGRDPLGWFNAQYVTKFKVLYSLDCEDFHVITDEDGEEKRFQGNSSPNDTVTRYLPERVRAMCVRLNPTAWEKHISLRFDVLGCYHAETRKISCAHGLTGMEYCVDFVVSPSVRL